MYHYEPNSILATPINGLTNTIIFEAYKIRFEMFESKGFKVKMNMMDNQATKHINSSSPKRNVRYNSWNCTTNN